MGIFDRSGGGSTTPPPPSGGWEGYVPPPLPSPPSPLSRERIEAALKANDWHYQTDSDGDICGLWGDNLFYFFTAGERKEILYVRGRWHQALSIDERAVAREVLDDWHRDRLWPKGFTRVSDDGELRVFAELAIDFEHGVNDQQLSQSVVCAISTSMQLFEHLAEKFNKTK